MVKYKAAHILWPTLYLHECFRLHRMHELQIVVTNIRSLSVCLSRVSPRLHCAKMAGQIKMLLGVNIPGGSWNIVLDVGPDPQQRVTGPILNFGDPSHLRNG